VVAEQIARAKTLKELTPLSDAYATYATVRKALVDLQPLLSDPDEELRELFTAEQEELLESLDAALDALPELLLPPSETAGLPAVMSLNAGVGGSESALFVEEMARLYQRFAEKRGWKIEIISKTEGNVGKGTGGLREITIKFDPPPYSDAEVYGLVKWERGVHRVQRVPLTETMGRVHTSTIAAVVSLTDGRRKVALGLVSTGVTWAASELPYGRHQAPGMIPGSPGSPGSPRSPCQTPSFPHHR
jgi:peptide chain release factor 1